jgi:hypothetical protein
MRISGLLKRLAAGAAALFAMAWGGYAKFGAYWPTEPAIAPSTTGSAESSPVSPFAIKNDSDIFTIKDARFTCSVDRTLFKIGDEKGWTMALFAVTPPGAWQKKSEPTDILPGKTAYYFCGANDMVRDVQINHEPARLRGMQARIAVDYAVDFWLFVWPRHYDSDTFTCDVSDGKCQWIVGELIH